MKYLDLDWKLSIKPEHRKKYSGTETQEAIQYITDGWDWSHKVTFGLTYESFYFPQV